MLEAAWRQAIIEVYGALRLAKVAVLRRALHRLNLVRVCRDQAGLSRAGDDLNVDVVLAGEEQALPYRELAQALFLLASQLEDTTEDIDGRG